MSGWAWAGAAAGGLLLAVLLRRPLGWLGRLALRSGVWLAVLWLLRAVSPLLGIHLGVNLFNAVALGALGLPGLALLLMTQWIIG
ncbi:MAG: pro-sigmaK processing inhibitor BofA family protein [Candidatus Enterenecus sp.]